MKQTFIFSNASIVNAIDCIDTFLSGQKVDKKDIIRSRILAEEVLIGWLEKGISTEFTLTCETHLKKPSVILEAEGETYNVLEKDSREKDSFWQVFSQNLLHEPSYSYRKGKNVITFDISRKKRSQIFSIVVAILFGIAVGLICTVLMSESLVSSLLSNFINPLYTAAFRLLGFISGPLILLSVTWGIYGIGDVTSLEKVGKKTLLRYLSVVFIIAACAGAFFPFFGLNFSDTQQSGSVFQSVTEMLLDIIPSNLLAPFISGNTLQIIFCAVIIGIAMIYLRKKVSLVADLVEQTNFIVQFLMEFISKMMPALIFLIMFRIVLNKTLSTFTVVWKLCIVILIACIAICTFFTFLISLRYKVSPFVIIRKSIPTFLIAITTASSAAAFASNMNTAKNKFGIDESLCAFGIPLGMVMCKTATVAYYVLISFFFANQFGIDISVTWILTAVFVSAMLAIATPPIPGGGAAAYTMLFTKLLLPDEALAIILSVDIIFDFLRTAANMYNLPLILIGCASGLGKLDRAKLKAKK